MINLVLFGPPGSGKGTQAENIIQKFQLTHISTGDILRSEVSGETPLGLEAKKFMDQGLLVPDEVVIGMLGSKIDATISNTNGYIFDGFPRTVAQAEALDKLLEFKKTSINQVLALEVDDEELVKRILLRGETSNRSDDQDESIIRNRIVEYNNKTAPVAEFYGKQGKFTAVKGVGSVDEIFESLAKEIQQIA